jgi:hypothetical protein
VLLWRNRDASISTTSSAVIERSTSMVKHSLLYSSTNGIIFSLRSRHVSLIDCACRELYEGDTTKALIL